MKWKYWIPHEWPEERTSWAELFLRPDDPCYHDESLWVTICCRGNPPGENASQELAEWYDEICTWLNGHPYKLAVHGEMGDADLVVNAPDFSREEFLEWVRVWMLSHGWSANELVAGSLQDFVSTHPQIDLMADLINKHPPTQ